MNINLRSINTDSKKDQFHALLDQFQPDVVIGTESWLHKDIHNAEVFPVELGYEVFSFHQ